MEEDHILINYISVNGEGVWNNIARAAGTVAYLVTCYLFLFFSLYFQKSRGKQTGHMLCLAKSAGNYITLRKKIIHWQEEILM